MFSKSVALRFVCLAFIVSITSASWGINELFQAPQSYYPGGYDATSIAVGDVNGDGKPDLLAAVYCRSGDCDRGGVGVLLGNGDGTFQAARTYDSGGSRAQSIAISDVNGDGKPDVLVANLCVSKDDCGGIAGVLLGNGDGTFQAAQTYLTGGSWANMIAVGDVNGDGKPDLLLANSCPGNDRCDNGIVGVLLGNGDGTFQTVQTYSSGALDAMAIAVADVNRDGKPDLVVANYCGGSCHGGTSVLIGNGNGTFQVAQTYDSGGFFGWSVAVADVNGDDKPDLLVDNLFVSNKRRSHGVVGVLLGKGDGTFQKAQTYGSGGYEPYSMTVGDVNGDGKPDLLLGNYCVRESSCPSGGVGVLLGNGDGTFGMAQHYSSGGDGAASIAVADVNGDGKPDLLVGNQTGGVGVLLARYITTTNLSSSPNPSVYGQSVTLTASVSSDGPSATAGAVTFKNGAKWLGKATLNAGVATLTTTKLPEGTLSITARYNGDVQSVKSTSPALIQVVQ